MEQRSPFSTIQHGECMEISYNSNKNAYSVSYEAGQSLETSDHAELSLTAPAFDEVPDLDAAGQSSAAFKDFQLKGNQNVNLKVQNVSKPVIPQLGNCNFVQRMRSFEDDNSDYNGGHSNVGSSSFEFHKGDRAFHRSVLGSLTKSAPSKWDDAEKWLVSLSPGDSHVKNKSKAPPARSQPILAHSTRKVSVAGLMAHQLGAESISKTASSNASEVLFDNMLMDGRTLTQDKGETKKIDSKSAFTQAASHPVGANSNISLDCYAFEDVSNYDLDNLMEVNADEAFVNTSLRNEKPVADTAIVLSKHAPLLSLHDTTTYVPLHSTVRSVSMRDIGTEMTPITSQEPSRTGTPIKSTTPIAWSPISSRSSTPVRAAPASTPMEPTENELDHQEELRTVEFLEKELNARTRQEIMALGEHLGKTNIAAWASKEEEEEDASQSLTPRDLEEVTKNTVETRAAAWEEAERAKYMARYKREEVKIQAWENQQKAKAEAEMRRIEVKAERMKSRAHERLLNKLAAAQRRAEEKHAAAEAKQVEQAAKTTQLADYIRRTGRIPIPFFHRGS